MDLFSAFVEEIRKMSKNKEFSGFFADYIGYIVIFVIIYILTTLFVILKPRGFAIPQLEEKYDLFGASFTGFILLLLIGAILLYFYFSTRQSLDQAPFLLYWGISFLIYAITLLGLCMEALGFDFANMEEPLIFLFWRSPMIFWVAGMWIGTSKLFQDNFKINYIPALLIILLGEIWFIFGLLILGDVEFTMYGFLYWEFIPMGLVLAILWYNYGKRAELSSPKLITFGFLLFCLAYMGWAPWHFAELRYIWYILFHIFLIGLSLIFTGFYSLPKEILAKLPDSR